MRFKRPLNIGKILCIFCACLVVCFFSSPLYSQDKELNGKVTTIIQKNVRRAKNALSKEEEKIKNDYGKYIQDQKTGKRKLQGTDSQSSGPVQNPLDAMGGHLDRNKSWNEYSVDSRIILNEETFPQCLEPRLVAEYKNGAHLYVDPANILMGLACDFNCHFLHFWPFPVNPALITQQWKVFSYYWPEHQISINKSGAQMIDPDIVNENRGAQELYRQPTAQKEDSDGERGQQAQLNLLKKMGISTDLFKDPKYHKAGQEPQLQQDDQVRYGSSMRTNLDAQAAHEKPPRLLGWEESESCLFNALPDKTDKKKIIHNRFDQGIYAISARYPETRRTLDPERYLYTSPQAIELQQYKDQTPNQFRESLCASWRMGSNPDVYGDLKKVGFKGINNPKYRTYCLPNGEALSGSMETMENTPRLQADAVRAVMSAVFFGSDKGGLKRMNSEPIRPNWYTLYEKRESSAVPRYVGSGIKRVDINPGENKSNVIFVDKLQRIYPTQPIGSGNSDAVGGASSEGQRTYAGQRGSHCFRPEDIPNWSSEGRTNVSEWPLGLMQDVRKNFGESRWAVWNRRVVCSCELEAGFPGGVGCLNLNSGDKEQAGFLGTIPQMGEMPPPFKKAIPVVKQLADKKSPPSGGGPHNPGLELPIVDIGPLGAGLSAPNMPGGQNPPANEQGPDADLDLLLICIPLEGQPQASGKPSGQPSAGASLSPEAQKFRDGLSPEEQKQFDGLTPSEQAQAVSSGCLS